MNTIDEKLAFEYSKARYKNNTIDGKDNSQSDEFKKLASPT